MIKPENIAIDETRISETQDMAEVYFKLDILNKSLIDFEQLPLWRQAEGIKAIINSSRDCLSQLTSHQHLLFNEITRLKMKFNQGEIK